MFARQRSKHHKQTKRTLAACTHACTPRPRQTLARWSAACRQQHDSKRQHPKSGAQLSADLFSVPPCQISSRSSSLPPCAKLHACDGSKCNSALSTPRLNPCFTLSIKSQIVPSCAQTANYVSASMSNQTSWEATYKRASMLLSTPCPTESSQSYLHRLSSCSSCSSFFTLFSRPDPETYTCALTAHSVRLYTALFDPYRRIRLISGDTNTNDDGGKRAILPDALRSFHHHTYQYKRCTAPICDGGRRI